MQKLKGIISSVFEINAEDITDKTSPDNTENWDSFNAMILVTELENNYNIKLTMDEVRQMACVKDIKSVLEKHGVLIVEEGV